MAEGGWHVAAPHCAGRGFAPRLNLLASPSGLSPRPGAAGGAGGHRGECQGGRAAGPSGRRGLSRTAAKRPYGVSRPSRGEPLAAKARTAPRHGPAKSSWAASSLRPLGMPRADRSGTSARPLTRARSKNAEAFGQHLYHEIRQRGLHRAQRQFVIGDGVEWIWNLSHIDFPDAIEIVDIYYAREHLWELSRQLFPLDREHRRRWVRRRKKQLDEGRIEHLVRSLRGIRGEMVRIKAVFFEGHAERMRYAEFRRQDLFVGSGVIESGCRTVVGRRKRSGMFWTVDGANAVTSLRCAQLSDRFDDYWEHRAAA